MDSKNLYFGAGKHVYLGRFSAAMVMKLILVELVMWFDFRLEDGESRLNNWVVMGLKILKPGTEILICD